jgi:predicted ATP-dependent serine protease
MNDACDSTLDGNKIPFVFEIFNENTNGGVDRGSVNVILSEITGGKTTVAVSLAADYMKTGHNVLYISIETSDNEILARLGANILEIPMHEISKFGIEKFGSQISKIDTSDFSGSIKVIQFPANSCHTGHFEYALNELRTKMHWKPSVIIVDYINAVGSSRVDIREANSHLYLKSVVEELKDIAIKHSAAVWTTMQLLRETVNDNPKRTIAADFAIVQSKIEEPNATGQLVFEQLRNRYKNTGHNTRIKMGVDVEYQSMFDPDKLEMI